MVWDFGAYGVTGFNYEGDESRVLIKIPNVCGRVTVLSPQYISKSHCAGTFGGDHTSSIGVTTLPFPHCSKAWLLEPEL